MREEAVLKAISKSVLGSGTKAASDLFLFEALILLAVDHMDTAEEGARISFQNLRGSIAKMNIDIDDSHTLQPPANSVTDGEVNKGRGGVRYRA
jgi:hypothetical protein